MTVSQSLMAEGLKSEKFGDATNFFELSDEEADWVVCYCHHGRQVDARTVAGAVRDLARTPHSSAGGWFVDAGIRLASRAHIY
jgi:hypothetical protein